MDLSKYYEQICKHPLLTKEEERELFTEMSSTDTSPERKAAIRDRIIKANLRFVFQRAKAFSRNDTSIFDELIAAGNEGLLVGFDKFRPADGNRLLTYAEGWIRQRILKQMSSFRIVSLPIWKQQLATKIQRFIDKNEAADLPDLVKAFPDVAEKDLRELLKTKYLTYYIEDLEGDSAFEINPIEEIVERRMDNARLEEVLASLPSQHADALRLTYGLLDGVEWKQEDIASRLGINRMTLRKLRKEALEMLSEALGGENPF